MSDWFDEGGDGKEVDVSAVFDSKVPELLAELVQLGALVSIGTTSDGGALGVTVTLDGRWRRQYFRESEEAVEWLEVARDGVADSIARASASTAPRKRSRRTRAS